MSVRIYENYESLIDILKFQKNRINIKDFEKDQSNTKLSDNITLQTYILKNNLHPKYNSSIADNSQIGNIIVLVKQKLEDNSEYTIDKHKELVRKALKERDYPIETIEEWLEYIE